MKILSQNEVDEAAEVFIIKEHLDGNSDMYYKETFKAGVEFAESKFEELAIEFAKYLFSTEITKHTSMKDSVKYIPSEFSLMKGDLIKNGEELFKLFLKERNKKE